MQYKFNIADNANTSAKELAFAKSYGYQEWIPTSNGDSMILNPETPKDFSERTLKKIFLEPWATQRAQSAYQVELNNSLGD